MNKFKSFEVVKSLSNFSIVKDSEGAEHTYPKSLTAGSIVNLIVEKIDNEGKIWFDTDILSNVEEYFINAEFIRKTNNNSNYGTIEVSYKQHFFSLRTPSWMMSDDYTFPEIIKILLKNTFNNKKRIDRIYIHDIKHPHYELNKTYEFIIGEYLKSTNQVIIHDDKTGNSYRALKHFSQLRIESGIKKNYVFTGTDKYYNCNFHLSDFDFLDPKSILKEDELLLVLDNHLVDSALRLEFLSQLKKEDSLWIITLTRYLVKVVINYTERNKLNEAFLINKTNLKLLGFCFDKDIFKNIPSKQTRTNVEKNYKNAKELNDVCTHLLMNDLSDLFNSKIINSDESSQILNLIFKHFKFKIIEIENFINILIKSTEHIENTEVSKHIIRLRNAYINFLEKTLLYNFSNNYFFDKNKKEKWLLNNEFHLHLKILEIFKNSGISSDQFYNGEFNITVLYQLMQSIIEKEKSANNFVQSTIQILPEEFKKNDIEIIDSQVVIDGKFENHHYGYSTVLSNDKMIITSSYYRYLINYYLTEISFQCDFKIISNSNNKILFVNPEFGYSKLCDQSFNKINDGDEVDVIVKNIASNIGVYGTYYFDVKENKFYEGIIRFKNNNSYVNSKTVKIGQILKCLVKKNDVAGSSKITLFPCDNPFTIEENNFTAEGEIIKINKANNKCPSCSSYNLKYLSNKTKIICKNDECGTANFVGAYVYLYSINKYIFINKSSIHGSNNFSFFDNLRTGARYNFFIESSKEISITLANNEITTQVYNVQPSEIIFSKSIIPLHIYVNAFLRNLFILINDSIDFNSAISLKEKKEFSRFSRQIGGILKNPKTYFLALVENYNLIIEKFKNNEEISKEINEFKVNAESNFKETFDRYPDIKILLQIIYTLQYVGNDNYSDQIKNLSTEKKLLNKLQKLVLIYNLIKSEESDSSLALKFRKKIIDFLAKKTDGIFSFNQTDQGYLKESEEERILKLIEKGEIGEDKSTEFKETLKTPVLNNKQHKIISKLKTQGENEKEIRKIQNSINIKDKIAQSNVTMSTFKNICAMLNSNNGQIIIGVRDDLSLIGLEEDYKLLGGYDEFQQYFDAKWNNILCSCHPSLYIIRFIIYR